MLDYSDHTKPFIKLCNKTSESSIAFNAKYLSQFSNQRVSILITAQEKPAIILSKNSKIDPHSKDLGEEVLKEDWFYVLMPIRLEKDDNASLVYL